VKGKKARGMIVIGKRKKGKVEWGMIVKGKKCGYVTWIFTFFFFFEEALDIYLLLPFI